MITIYSTIDKVHFEFEAQEDNLPLAIMELAKWLEVRMIAVLDPNVAKDEKEPQEVKEHWYMFNGKDNVSGTLVAEAEIKLKRFQ